MSDINQLVISGRLTDDPEMSYTTSGKAVGKFGMAVGRKWKSNAGEIQEETSFCTVKAFGKMIEFAHKHLRKGHPAIIQGSIREERWQDKTSGGNRSKIVVHADRITPAKWFSSKSDREETAQRPQQSQQPQPQHDSGDDVPF